MRSIATLLFIVSLAPSQARAAVCEARNHPGVVAFYITQTTKPDSASEEWVSAFRELLRKSPSYCLVDQRETATMVLSLVGLDTEGKSATAVSIAVYFAKDQAFVAHRMYIAARENVESSAQRALANLDEEVKDLKRSRFLK